MADDATLSKYQSSRRRLDIMIAAENNAL